MILLNTKSRKTAIWLTNAHHNIFWNGGENSFPQTRKYLRTITSGKQIICKALKIHLKFKVIIIHFKLK